MPNRKKSSRRRLVKTTAGLLTLGLAGCLSGPASTGGEVEDQDSTPAATDQPSENSHDEEDTPHSDETEDHHADKEHHTEEGVHTEGGHGAEGPHEAVTVEMQSLESGEHFHPHVAWIEPGGTITFENVSGAHSATAYHPDNGKPRRVPEDAEGFDSGILNEEGATFEHTFDSEGVYDIYCTPHEQLGMIGTVLVGKPDPHDQPGLAEPQDEFSDTAASKLEELNDRVNTMLGHEH